MPIIEIDTLGQAFRKYAVVSLIFFALGYFKGCDIGKKSGVNIEETLSEYSIMYKTKDENLVPYLVNPNCAKRLDLGKLEEMIKDYMKNE
jgi:hypothetical protein